MSGEILVLELLPKMFLTNPVSHPEEIWGQRFQLGVWSTFLSTTKILLIYIPLSANPTKLSNTRKQFVGKLPTNCLSVFDHFVILKGHYFAHF